MCGQKIHINIKESKNNLIVVAILIISTRLGGDEFGLILEQCNLVKAIDIAKTIIEAVNDHLFLWGDTKCHIGVSIGILEINKHHYQVSDVLKYLDAACYTAKDNGRNTFHLYGSNDLELKNRAIEMNWLSHIDTALAEKYVLKLPKQLP